MAINHRTGCGMAPWYGAQTLPQAIHQVGNGDMSHYGPIGAPGSLLTLILAGAVLDARRWYGQMQYPDLWGPMSVALAKGGWRSPDVTAALTALGHTTPVSATQWAEAQAQAVRTLDAYGRAHSTGGESDWAVRVARATRALNARIVVGVRPAADVAPPVPRVRPVAAPAYAGLSL